MFQSRILAVAALPVVLAAGLASASPAEAQSRHDRNGRYEQSRDRSDNRSENALVGALIGGLAGAVVGDGDGRQIVTGALAGAAIGMGASNGGNRADCNYYRGGRCYRNQGHWEREHGINSRDARYRGDRYGNDRRHETRDRRDYRHDRRW